MNPEVRGETCVAHEHVATQSGLCTSRKNDVRDFINQGSGATSEPYVRCAKHVRHERVTTEGGRRRWDVRSACRSSLRSVAEWTLELTLRNS